MKNKLLLLFACMFIYAWQVGAQTVVTEATTWDLTANKTTIQSYSNLNTTKCSMNNSWGYVKLEKFESSKDNNVSFKIPAGTVGILTVKVQSDNSNSSSVYVTTDLDMEGTCIAEATPGKSNKDETVRIFSKQFPLNTTTTETTVYIYNKGYKTWYYEISWIPQVVTGDFKLEGDPNIIASGAWNEDEFNTYIGTIGADKVTSVNFNKVSDFNGTLPLSSVTNPNCLYYVTSAMYAAASDKKNLVSDDKAEVKTAENIVLADGNPFLNQVDFTATTATYTRTFTAAGTYSVCLPFAVASIPTEVTVLEYKGSNGAKVNFSPVSAMTANTPYLVEVSADNINKEIKFEAVTNTTVEASASVSVADEVNNAYSFNSNFEPFTTTADQGLYLLEAGGKGFVKAGTASVGSFRAYMAPVSNELAKAPRLVIGNDEGGATGIDASEAISRKLSVYSAGGVLELNSPVAQRVKVYGVDGRLVRVLQLSEGSNVVSGLAKGMYVIANRKVVVK